MKKKKKENCRIISFFALNFVTIPSASCRSLGSLSIASDEPIFDLRETSNGSKLFRIVPFQFLGRVNSISILSEPRRYNMTGQRTNGT